MVFISHASRDTWIATHIAADIERAGRPRGTTTFLDAKDIEPGGRIDECIRKNVAKCSSFLVLLSSCSLGSQWVLIECGMALGFKKPIFGILDKVNPAQIPAPLVLTKAIDLSARDRFLQIHDLRRFLLRYIDVYLY
jgi:hypothetical protein